MLLHANSLPDDAFIQSDLCILGGGAAGITIAHSLRGSGLAVILLESGEKNFDAAAQELNSGKNVGIPYEPLDALRLRMFGGTTNHWEGSCNDLDEIDFMHRPWVPHCRGWPIRKEDLVPYYRRAQTYLQLAEYDYDLASWSKRLAIPYPNWIHDGLAGGVTQQSPPTRFGQAYESDLEKDGNLRVLLGATALSLEMTANRKVTLAVNVGRVGRKSIVVRARRFVLAMGGIENARFLLLNDFGRRHGDIGRYFMDHPYFRLMLLTPSQRFLQFKRAWDRYSDSGGNIHPELKLAQNVIRQGQFQNARLAYEPITHFEASTGIESFHQVARGFRSLSGEELLFHIGNMLLDIDLLADAAGRTLGADDLLPEASEPAGFIIGCMTEQLPNPDSRVSLSGSLDYFGQRKVQVALDFTDGDRVAMGRLVVEIARTFGQAGLGRVRTLEPNRFATWPPRLISFGSHNIGTTRMSSDPKDGVVDANLKLRSTSNLYIAGSSVFPTGGHVPPTLTIVALALRLSDHLKAIDRVP